MEGDQANAASAAPKEEAQGRQRSTIAFPYADLNAAVDLANAIHTNVGSGECDDDQLAAWTNQSVKSSGFRTQIYGARMFSILEGEGGRHRLSELGRSVVDPNRAREARARAFLAVPLYRAIYEGHRGGVIPPAAALEREIVGLGVAEKQKDKARQVFERSADQAGFFEHGRNRLVMPGISSGQPQDEKPREEESGGNGGGGGGGTGNGGDGVALHLDPLLLALLKKIPATGAEWPATQRLRWFRTFAMNVSQIYDEDAMEPVEMKIDLDEAAN